MYTASVRLNESTSLLESSENETYKNLIPYLEMQIMIFNFKITDKIFGIIGNLIFYL